MRGKLLVCAAAALALWGRGHAALACGLFWPSNARVVPTLGVERTLIVFDPKAEREHFVREVRFRGAAQAFAFVVPVPSRPEVAKADGALFDQLQKTVPFQRAWAPATENFLAASTGSLFAQGFGSGHGRAGGGGVSVVSTERVGSFTAAVLEASDAGALDRWLKENDFAVGQGAQPWLDRYTRLGFSFVAFRYEKPTDAIDQMRSEVVRISFATPQPFYPYREPSRPGAAPPGERLLRLWFVAPEPMLPVALRSEATQHVFMRPWEEGLRADVIRSELEAASLGPLLPEGERLWVQTFLDQKNHREGWGDALLVPTRASPLSEEQRARRRSLLRLLLPEAKP